MEIYLELFIRLEKCIYDADADEDEIWIGIITTQFAENCKAFAKDNLFSFILSITSTIAKMSTLASQLSAIAEGINQNAPAPVASSIKESIAGLKATFDKSAAIQVGDSLPAFKLPNALGNEVASESLLAKGPVLITFYRGDWCPFCNLALRSLQLHLDEFHAKGVTIVAISPELPNTSLSTTEKNELKFEVLSDIGNKFARQLGIVWDQPKSVEGVFKAFEIDLKARNGDDSVAVPIPTTILVDAKGVVRNIHIDPDYMQRLEPTTALKWVDAL